MKISVLDIKGSKVEDVNLNDEIWDIEPHKQAIFDSIMAQKANMRQGTHKVKNRSEVSGGGRKPWKQKGTGRARQGSIRSPQWRGGGVVFGPNTNRNYTLHVNRKVRKLAMKSALSFKAKNNQVMILNSLEMEKASTKEFVSILKTLKIDDKKISLVTKEPNNIVTNSSNNIPNIKHFEITKLSVKDIIDSNLLLLTKDVVNSIEEALI